MCSSASIIWENKELELELVDNIIIRQEVTTSGEKYSF